MTARAAWGACAFVVAGLLNSRRADAEPPVDQGATESAPAESTMPAARAELDPEGARRAAAEAVRLRALSYYDAGDYSAARREFERANQLLPSFRLLYNLGVVSLALADPASAYDYFQLCLAQGGADLPDERRSELEKQLRDLSSRTSLLTVTVDISGALILVDDRPVAEAPLAAPLRRNPGTARISARLANGHTASRSVNLAAGQAVQVNLEFAVAPPLVVQHDAGRPERQAPWVGWAATAVLATGAAVAGLETLSAQNDYQSSIARIGTTRAELDQLDTKTTRWSVTADALTGAAVIVGVYSLYLTLRRPPVTASANYGSKNFSLQLQSQRPCFGIRF